MMPRHRIRFRFRKQGDLRWIGHRDLMRAVERLLRRAGLPLSMSEGFRPKPRLSFPSALAVGIEGADEVVQLELSQSLPADEVLAAVQAAAPDGLEFTACEIVPDGAGKPAVDNVTYEIAVPADRHAALRRRIADVLAADRLPVRRADSGKEKEIDVRGALEAMSLADDTLRFKIRVSRNGTPRPREVLAALGIEDLELVGNRMTRTVVELTT